MNSHGYCIFDTPLGACGIGWTVDDSSVSVAATHFLLPESTADRTESRIARLSGAARPGDPPPAIDELIEKVRAHLNGNPQDFNRVPVDLNGASDFERQVYRVARTILAGQTMTYGEIARAVNEPGSARAVGRALGRNPIPLIIPCHRVLAAGGKSGGFSAPGGRATKARLLAIEGVLLPFHPPGQTRIGMSEKAESVLLAVGDAAIDTVVDAVFDLPVADDDASVGLATDACGVAATCIVDATNGVAAAPVIVDKPVIGPPVFP